MNKPYLLFRNHNSPYWYAQIRLADGSLSNNKSTGKESRTEAEKVVMEWVVKGECPKRVSKKRNFIKTSVRTESKAARETMEFLIEFWDYEKSPYIRELHLQGKTFQQNDKNHFQLLGADYKRKNGRRNYKR